MWQRQLLFLFSAAFWIDGILIIVLKKLDKSGTEEYHYNRKNQLIGRLSEKDKTAYRYDQQGNLLEVAGAEERTVFSYKKSLYSPIPIKCAISLTEKASEKLDGVIELLGDIV